MLGSLILVNAHYISVTIVIVIIATITIIIIVVVAVIDVGCVNISVIGLTFYDTR